MDQDVADGGDQRRKGHDEGTCSHRRFQLHAQERGEHHQHHHAAACAHKARAKADGQAEKQGDRNAFPVQLRSLGRLILPAGIRADQKPDADAEGQKQREAAQHHVPDDEGHIASHRAHGQDADHHDPAAPQIDVPVLRVGKRRDGGTQDIRRQGDGCRLVRAGFSPECGAQHDQDGHHDRGGGKSRQPGADPRAQRRDDIPHIFHGSPSLTAQLYAITIINNKC